MITLWPLRLLKQSATKSLVLDRTTRLDTVSGKPKLFIYSLPTLLVVIEMPELKVEIPAGLFKIAGEELEKSETKVLLREAVEES